MYELPTTITVQDKEYKIRNQADYRTILGVIDVCTDPELTKEEQAISAFIIFFENINTIDDLLNFDIDFEEGVRAMMKFINLNDSDEVSTRNNIKLIDWQQDETLIVSAINSTMKLEIRSLEYLHWWTFVSYFMAIGDSALANVVSIRQKIAKGKKLEKYEKEFKQNNPQYFKWKRKELEKDLLFKSIWNVGKEDKN